MRCTKLSVGTGISVAPDTFVEIPGELCSKLNVTSSEARVTDCVDDLMKCHYLPPKSWKSYLRYVRVARLCVKPEKFMEFFMKGRSEVEGRVAFSVHHLDDVLSCRCCPRTSHFCAMQSASFSSTRRSHSRSFCHAFCCAGILLPRLVPKKNEISEENSESVSLQVESFEAFMISK